MLEKQKTEEEIFQDRADDAVFLVEGWENLGLLEGQQTYRGVVGPWVIVVRVKDREIHTESSYVTAVAENQQLNKSHTYTPSQARQVLRRATFDEKRRVLLREFPKPRRKRKKTTRKGTRS